MERRLQHSRSWGNTAPETCFGFPRTPTWFSYPILLPRMGQERRVMAAAGAEVLLEHFAPHKQLEGVSAPPPPPRPWLGPKLAAPFNEDEIRASSSGRASIPAHSGLGLKIDSPSVWKAGGSGLRWRPRWGVEALQTLRLARLLPSGAPGSRTGACCKSKTPPPPAPAHSSLGSSPPLTAGDAFVKFKD